MLRKKQRRATRQCLHPTHAPGCEEGPCSLHQGGTQCGGTSASEALQFTSLPADAEGRVVGVLKKKKKSVKCGLLLSEELLQKGYVIVTSRV